MIKKISIITKNYVNKILYFIFKYKIYKKYLNGIVAEVGAGHNPFYKTKSTIYFDKYAEILEIDVRELKKVGELCDKLDPEKENCTLKHSELYLI